MTYDELIPAAALAVFSGCVGRNARIPAAAAREAKTLAEALAVELGITAEPAPEAVSERPPSAVGLLPGRGRGRPRKGKPPK